MEGLCAQTFYVIICINMYLTIINLLKIVKDKNFPSNVKEAILRGFEAAENEFINNIAMNRAGDVLDRSGSCAIVTLIVDNTCYIINVGDSRSLMSSNSSKNIQVLTKDHKPNEIIERKRIVEAGGKVYQ